jgi:hypothetical protein
MGVGSVGPVVVIILPGIVAGTAQKIGADCPVLIHRDLKHVMLPDVGNCLELKRKNSIA